MALGFAVSTVEPSCEVIYSVWKRGEEIEARSLEKNAARLPLLILPADRERATNAAAVKVRDDLGYADSFAAALAMEYSATQVTADPEFAKLGKRLANAGASTTQPPRLELPARLSRSS